MSEPRPASGNSDVNLLFGVLAVQMDFVDRDELVAAMNAWIIDKARPLGAILCERGKLSPARRDLLDALVREHLLQHGGDGARSLASLATASEAARALEVIPDADLRHSLQQLTKSADSPGDSATSTPQNRDQTRYRPLRSHARGGLGEVFVAEDVELHREVALKEIQEHRADDPGSRARFVLEAEITGGLEHPGIVPVYGLGTYPNGRPFYAMRFIRGDSLQAAIERYHLANGDPVAKRMEFRELLGRLIDVGNAIAYAHSRGVIHRDLKPANVMLGRYGETLVVDWGLAKARVDPLLNAPSPDAPTSDPMLKPVSGSGEQTRPGSIIGTPSYMSPEQAAGEGAEVGPATDIYGLGAILFAILTGRKPYEGHEVLDIIERVKTGEFPKPRSFNRDAPAALEAICLKAMAKKPADRFETATALVAEVNHWLADEPTQVYRDPWTVRLSRWSRRHRVMVSSLGVFLVCAVLALSVGAALIWNEQKKTAEQKKIAEENYGLASELSRNAVRLVASSEAELASSPDSSRAREEILREASRFFRKQLSQNPQEVEFKRRAREVFRYTANVLFLHGDFEEAEAIFGEASNLARQLEEGLPDEISDRIARCQMVRDHGRFLVEIGRLREAKKMYLESLELTETLLTAQPASPAVRRIKASTLQSLAWVERSMGETVRARDRATNAVELFRSLSSVPPNQQHPYDPVLLGSALTLLAMLERDLGNAEVGKIHVDANKQLEPLLKTLQMGLNLSDVLHVRSLSRFEQARTFIRDGKELENAEANLAATIQQWKGLVKRFPLIWTYREASMRSLRTSGEWKIQSKRFEEGIKELLEARTIVEEGFEKNVRTPSILGEAARIQLAIGIALQTGKASEKSREAFALATSYIEEAIQKSSDNKYLQQIRSDIATADR